MRHRITSFRCVEAIAKMSLCVRKRKTCNAVNIRHDLALRAGSDAVRLSVEPERSAFKVGHQQLAENRFLRAFRNIVLIMKLGRVRSLEADWKLAEALEALNNIKYEGDLAGVQACYIARLMVVTRDVRALSYVRELRRFLREHEPQLDHYAYCLAYANYLEAVLLHADIDEAGKIVRHQKSTAFVRSTLLVS